MSKKIQIRNSTAEGAAIRKFRNTASDGKQYLTTFYNLDAIIFESDFARAIKQLPGEGKA